MSDGKQTKLVVSLVGVVLLLLCVLGVLLFRSSSQNQPTPNAVAPQVASAVPATPPRSGEITRVHIKQLAMGMTRKEVEAILESGQKMPPPAAWLGQKPASEQIDTMEFFSHDTQYPAEVVVTYKNGRMAGYTAPKELMGMIADDSEVRSIHYRTTMMQGAYSLWNRGKGSISVFLFERKLSQAEQMTIREGKVWDLKPLMIIRFLGVGSGPDAVFPRKYQLEIYKRDFWPSNYTQDIVSVGVRRGKIAQELQTFKIEKEGSKLSFRLNGQSTKPMFESTPFVSWDLEIGAKVLNR